MATSEVAKPHQNPLGQVFHKGQQKYYDRFPDYPSAGVSSKFGDDTVCSLLKPPHDPSEPPRIQRFKNWTTSTLGEQRVFHGQANDLQRKVAREMIHGVKSAEGEGVKKLVNPTPLTRFQERVKETQESVYESIKTKPLGRVPDPLLPEHIKPYEFVFGIKTVTDGNAKELINPDKTFGQVFQENQDDHDTYLMTHKRLHPGEQGRRKYDEKSFQESNVFGVPTPSFQDGRLVKQTLHWIADERAQKCTPIVAKRVEDFRERTQFQLGKVLDPIADTMNVEPGHTYGMISTAEPYGVPELLRGEVPRHYVRGDDKHRGIVGAARQRLRTIGFYHFADLWEMLKHLDKDQTGVLPRPIVRRIFSEVNVPLDHELLEQLFDYSSDKMTTNDSVDWAWLLRVLDWKSRIDLNAVSTSRSTQSADCSTPRRIRPKVNEALLDWTTSSSSYNAGHGVNLNELKTYGSPNRRSDLPIPKSRKNHDQTNYGDEGYVYALLNPSILTNYGVRELDMKLPRSKEEMWTILSRSECDIQPSEFDALWSRALAESGTQSVSMDQIKPMVFEKLAEKIRDANVLH